MKVVPKHTNIFRDETDGDTQEFHLDFFNDFLPCYKNRVGTDGKVMVVIFK